MAPELFQKKGYSEKIDIFAIGTLIWEILTRKIPYDGFDINEIKSKVLKSEELFLPKTIPQEFLKIINSCRDFNESKRPSFEEIAKEIDSVIKI